jgi:hypothetical protein
MQLEYDGRSSKQQQCDSSGKLATGWQQQDGSASVNQFPIHTSPDNPLCLTALTPSCARTSRVWEVLALHYWCTNGE